MKFKWIKFGLLLAYCTPFAFLAMNGDFQSRSLSFYYLMLVSFSVLSFIAIKSDNKRLILSGNLLSFISSYIFIQISNLNEGSWYFKPLTAVGLLIALSVIMFIIQFGITRIVKNKKMTTV